MKTIAAYAVLVLLTIAQAHAQQTLGEVIDKGGQKLSKDELAGLLPGTKHTSQLGAQGTRAWAHNVDGKLSATSLGGSANTRGGPLRGEGTWNVIDPGKYCFNIEWPRSTEKRCMFVYKLGDAYFGVGDDADKSISQMLRFTLEK